MSKIYLLIATVLAISVICVPSQKLHLIYSKLVDGNTVVIGNSTYLLPNSFAVLQQDGDEVSFWGEFRESELIVVATPMDANEASAYRSAYFNSNSIVTEVAHCLFSYGWADGSLFWIDQESKLSFASKLEESIIPSQQEMARFCGFLTLQHD